MRRVEYVMGTAVSFDVRDLEGAAADEALHDVVAWLHFVDNTFSTYKPESQVSRLARGELRRSDCSPEVRFVLDACERLKTETDGYFDARANGTLDPSGFVKGWSVEVASSMLLEHGCASHCINAGGDVRVRGVPQEQQVWTIGIVHPLDPKALTTLVGVGDAGVATSGTAERGAHVFDPHRHAPANGLLSVTIVGPELAYTDAYATAAVAMGRRAPDWLITLPDRESYVIDTGGFAWWTPGFVRHAPALASL